MKIRYLRAVLFALLAIAPSAHAFITLDAIVPTSPMAGETVSARVSAGDCDAIIEAPGYPQITQTGNIVRMLLETAHTDDLILCNSTPGTVNLPFGEFPAGSYSLQLDRHYVDFFGADVFETVGMLPFVVQGAGAATSLPTLGSWSLLVLGIGVLTLAGFMLRRRLPTSVAIVLVFAMLPHDADAQTDPEPDRYVQVLLSTEPGAPTPDEVVHYFSFSPPVGPPPLDAFDEVAPTAAGYLLPLRATGDFLAYLLANPDTPRAILERYLIIGYTPESDIEAALSSLRDDPYVSEAYLPLETSFSSVSLVDFDVGNLLEPLGVPAQYGWDAFNTAAAWQLAGGYAVIGSADSGLAVNHPALRQFSATGQYLGGNFIPLSLDLGGWPTAYDADVNEVTPMPLSTTSFCNPEHIPNYAPDPAFAGHGTHVAGLQAANSFSGLGVKGICKNCGILMWKVAQNQCTIQNQQVELRINALAIPPAITLMADTGVQVINLSFGSSPTLLDYCAANAGDPYCLALANATYRDVVIVASSGNDRTRLRFPARDTRVVSAGGFDSNFSLWDESPGSTTFCPNPNNSVECGSNYTTVFGEPRQELMGSSKAVFSTMYPGKDWVPNLGCGDSFGTPSGDGLGLCTGTSMSAPQVAGVVGILRSINPLALASKPVLGFGDVPGVRSVLAQTTLEAQNNQPWSQTIGHGVPDAAAAAASMLGTVQGRTVKNRVTPLFRFHAALSKDYVETSSPQMAIALAINQAGAYVPQGLPIPGYPEFPPDPLAATALPTPLAAAYVLTTEYKPRTEWPALVPLHLMDRSRNFPLGCTTGAPGCNSANRDFVFMTTIAHIEQAHADGYNLRTIQGYIYQPCSNEPGCIPPGAQKFWRACKTADDDCATFLESERTTYEAAGYTVAYPSGSNKLLGYAYPYADTDGDGLIDGFEYVIGTKVNVADSDGDGTNDAAEFPMSGVPASDPCSGAAGRNCPAEIIFQNGFQ